MLTVQVTFDTNSHEQIDIREITEIYLPKCSEASFDLKLFLFSSQNFTISLELLACLLGW